ncbi:MAG: YegS/Rv2252/BmrU family lipid kinase [Clostridia bacterium]|nr:YegS/Rv2252/BmrU family lipid kinase [Clostridia bacterium]
MKHLFIINPSAGRVNHEATILESLKKYGNTIDYDVYRTTAPKDATRFIRQYCSEHSEDTCFYACGGDGTFNEVVNGAVEFDNAYVSVYACGSGNDFVKYYGGAENFLNIDNLVNGTPHKIDLIKIGDKYSVNVVDFGFDAVVATTMIKVKRKPIIGGKRAYTTGVIKALFTGMRNKCTLKIDGKPINDGEILLCTLGNAQFVGGSFRCSPKASNDDGMLEVCVIDPISRFKFLSLIGDYTAGKHLDNPKFNDILKYTRCKSIEVIAPEGFCISLDGEIIENNHFIAEIVPAALNFIVPKGAMPIVEDNFSKQQREKAEVSI